MERNGTPTKGTIPSTSRKGNFVVGDERRNSRATTIVNCVIE